MSKANCPGSATLTDDGKACKMKLDIPLYCGLTADAAPGWPRCYTENGAQVQVPPAPGASSSSSTGTGKSNLKPSCADILNTQYNDLLDSINSIHAFEGKLFGDLESVQNGEEASMSVTEIKGKISDLSKLRNQLYADLNNILTSTQCNLSDSRQNLADQIAMVEIVKNELDNAEKAIDELEIIRNNRRRMVEITDYEKLRYRSHKDIFKTIAFCGLGVLVSVYLVNAGWSFIGKSGIAGSIVIAIILTLKSVYDNWWRDDMNWDRIKFREFKPANGTTVLQHDIRAVEKLYGDTTAAVSNIESQAGSLVDNTYDAGEKVYGAISNATGVSTDGTPVGGT
uniref:Uncharacterized protein n=1 Tax=viral metagenome TaxID=1070528 RepID=A0A6C0C4S5_9ZZZZ